MGAVNGKVSIRRSKSVGSNDRSDRVLSDFDDEIKSKGILRLAYKEFIETKENAISEKMGSEMYASVKNLLQCLSIGDMVETERLLNAYGARCRQKGITEQYLFQLWVEQLQNYFTDLSLSKRFSFDVMALYLIYLVGTRIGKTPLLNSGADNNSDPPSNAPHLLRLHKSIETAPSCVVSTVDIDDDEGDIPSLSNGNRSKYDFCSRLALEQLLTIISSHRSPVMNAMENPLSRVLLFAFADKQQSQDSVVEFWRSYHTSQEFEMNGKTDAKYNATLHWFSKNYDCLFMAELCNDLKVPNSYPTHKIKLKPNRS